LYEKVFSKPYKAVSNVFWEDIDKQIVDATVDGIAAATRSGGDSTRKLQTGNLSDYLKIMGAGALIISIIALTASMKG
jgi:NADH-quinone oxidoreductase subunit L